MESFKKKKKGGGGRTPLERPYRESLTSAAVSYQRTPHPRSPKDSEDIFLSYTFLFPTQTCRAQSASMPENPMLAALGKEDGKGGGGRGDDNKGRKT